MTGFAKIHKTCTWKGKTWKEPDLYQNTHPSPHSRLRTNSQLVSRKWLDFNVLSRHARHPPPLSVTHTHWWWLLPHWWVFLGNVRPLIPAWSIQQQTQLSQTVNNKHFISVVTFHLFKWAKTVQTSCSRRNQYKRQKTSQSQSQGRVTHERIMSSYTKTGN